MSLTSASADYRDNSFRSKMTIVALLLIAFTASVSALLYFEEFKLWKAFNELDDFAEDRLDSLLLVQGLMGIFYFLLNILTVVFFLMWFRRAYANLGRLGIKHLDHEDSIAVWGVFYTICEFVPSLSGRAGNSDGGKFSFGQAHRRTGREDTYMDCFALVGTFLDSKFPRQSCLPCDDEGHHGVRQDTRS